MKHTSVVLSFFFGLILPAFAQNSPTPPPITPGGMRLLVPSRPVTNVSPFLVTRTNTFNTNRFIITRTNISAQQLPPGTYLATPYAARVIIPEAVDSEAIYIPKTNYTTVMPVIRPEVQLVPAK